MVIKIRTTVTGKNGKKHVLSVETTTYNEAYVKDIKELTTATDLIMNDGKGK